MNYKFFDERKIGLFFLFRYDGRRIQSDRAVHRHGRRDFCRGLSQRIFHLWIRAEFEQDQAARRTCAARASVERGIAVGSSAPAEGLLYIILLRRRRIQQRSKYPAHRLRTLGQ